MVLGHATTPNPFSHFPIFFVFFFAFCIFLYVLYFSLRCKKHYGIIFFFGNGSAVVLKYIPTKLSITININNSIHIPVIVDEAVAGAVAGVETGAVLTALLQFCSTLLAMF
jgi:hypothetical protein